jgi:hypothetical protein
MNVDDIVKLMVFGSISLSILGLSFQTMRIFGKVADIIGDMRMTIQNFGLLSSQLVEDYELVSKALRSFSDGISKINSNVINPISKVTRIIKPFSKIFSRDNSVKDDGLVD